MGRHTRALEAGFLWRYRACSMGGVLIGRLAVRLYPSRDEARHLSGTRIAVLVITCEVNLPWFYCVPDRCHPIRTRRGENDHRVQTFIG